MDLLWIVPCKYMTALRYGSLITHGDTVLSVTVANIDWVYLAALFIYNQYPDALRVQIG